MPLPVWLVTVCLKHRIPPFFFKLFFIVCDVCVLCAYGGQRETGVVPLPLLCEFWGLDSVYRKNLHTAEPSCQRPNLVCTEEQCNSFHTGPC